MLKINFILQIIDINACKSIDSKGFFPKDNSDRRFHNNRQDGPFHLRINILAEDFQFKEKKIQMVKPPKKTEKSKKNEESKSNEDKPPVSSKKGKKEKEKESEKEKSKIEIEEEDIKPEEGVLTFYIELQEETEDDKEKGLPSDSDDD